MGVPSVREAEETQGRSPLLFFLGEIEGETRHAFFDPIKRTLTPVVIPELGLQLECLSSGYGWLLLISREISSIFFFNPITRQRIELPFRKSIVNAATFTAPPTSSDCMVFAVETPPSPHSAKIRVSTLRVGTEKRWNNCTIRKSSSFQVVVHVMYSSGMLYCVDSIGRIAKFDVGNRTWTAIPRGPTSPKFRHSYLVNYNGKIYAGKKASCGVVEKLYRLDVEQGLAHWIEVKELEGVALFFGPYGSCSVLNEEFEKKVIIAADKPDAKCVIYNFDGGDIKKDIGFEEPNFGWCYTPVFIER